MGLTAGYAIAGKYRLVAPLGRGAMGEVWRAEHALLKSTLAIKILHPQLLGGDEGEVRSLMERFFREARATSTLRSPHVVQILDFGQDGAVPFIAMELLEGETLEHRIEQARALSPRETAAIVAQIARGVGKAHEAGIVHRDLKPANVFLVRSFDGELVKVLDFGIAKVATGPTGYKATQTGMTVGTPAYMSPEQVQASRALDHRADLWSLAVMAFECLTGDVPFQGDSFGALVLAICVHPPPRPSARHAVPPGFDAWFTKGVSRNPDERFQSAKELADSLHAVLCPDTRASQASGPGAEAEMAWAPTLPQPGAQTDPLTSSGSGPAAQGGGPAPAWGAPTPGRGVPAAQVAPGRAPTPMGTPMQQPPGAPIAQPGAPIAQPGALLAQPGALLAPRPERALQMATPAPQRPWTVILSAIAGAIVVLMITALFGYLRSRTDEPAETPATTVPDSHVTRLTADPVGGDQAPPATGAPARTAAPKARAQP